MAVATTTIAQLAAQVQDRTQNPDYLFWQQQNETYCALAEAINDLLLLIGRPTLTVNNQITLLANRTFQPMPTGMIAITNIRTNSYSLWKTSVRTMDYLQTSWGPDWQSEVNDDGPMRWGPLGWTYFFVHPAPTIDTLVNIDGIAQPILAWPPDGTEQSPFHNEFDVALQLYAAAYLRLKELGDDAFEGSQSFQQYIDIAQRMTNIEDRRDPLIFSRAFGTPTAPSLVSYR